MFIHKFRTAVIEAAIPVKYKFLLIAMAEHANWDTGDNCYPSQARLAKACQCSERSIRRHWQDLQAAGWLFLVSRGVSGGSPGQGRANVWRLAIGRDFTVDKSGPVFQDTPNVVSMTPLTKPKQTFRTFDAESAIASGGYDFSKALEDDPEDF